MTDAGIIRAFVDEIDELRAEVEKQTRLANVAAERMRTAEYREDLLKQDVERWEIVDAQRGASVDDLRNRQGKRIHQLESNIERLRAALRQILEDPDAHILDSHRDDGWAALERPKDG